MAALTRHDLVPAGRQKRLASFLRELRSLGAFKDATVFLNAERIEVPVEVNARLVRREGESLAVCVCRELGCRKSVELALDAAHENYRRLFDQAGI